LGEELEVVEEKTGTEPTIQLIFGKMGVMFIMQNTEAVKVKDPKKPSETIDAFEVTLKGILSVDDYKSIVQLLDGHKLHAKLLSKQEADEEGADDDD